MRPRRADRTPNRSPTESAARPRGASLRAWRYGFGCSPRSASASVLRRWCSSCPMARCRRRARPARGRGRRRSGGAGGQPRVRGPIARASRGRRGRADPPGVRRRRRVAARPGHRPADSTSTADRAGARSARRGGRHVRSASPGRSPSSSTRRTRRWPRPEIAEIVARAIERHGLCAAAAEHRIGTVPLSEPSVAIAASAPHRDAAFAGASEIIDEIKARAPIWKKEEGEWNEGTRPPTTPRPAEAPAGRPRARGGARRAPPACRRRREAGDRRAARDALLAGQQGSPEEISARARELLATLQRPSLRRVINATGVIVHTNLGRAPLPAAARDAVLATATGYSNLELDLERGERGSRHAHVDGLLRQLDGRRGRAGRQQRRGGRAARRRRAGRGRALRDRLPRPAGRDRRWVPDPGCRRAIRRAVGRGRDDQPDQAGRLRAGARRPATARAPRSSACTSRTSAPSGSSRRSRSRRCAGSARR